MNRQSKTVKTPARHPGDVYAPTAREIARRTAELQKHWTPRQRSRRAIEAPQHVSLDSVRPGERSERWVPGMI